MSANESNELSPSELGTKEYWESIYKRDIDNFENHGDAGEIWFGEDIVERILRWFEKNIPTQSKICDLGCGNGMFLVEAAQRGYTNTVGFDYCQEAVELAKAVAQSNKLNIVFKSVDLTTELDTNEIYDVLVDKGTYDAISLNPDNAKEARLQYIKNISKLLSEDGHFVITSCNWIEDELVQHFDGFFTMDSIIPTPTFQFGGKQGSLVSSVVFKKKSNSW